MLDALIRARIARLAAALRQFGLVDRFGLARLIEDTEPPTVEAMEARLRRQPGHLPAGLTVSYLARVLHRDVLGDEVDAERHTETEQALRELRAIAPGKENATRYQDQVITLFSLLFREELVFQKKEAGQHGGRKRIDVVYKNVATSGAFSDIWRVHGFRAPFIPVECKNYSDDAGNPEFDQLLGRLNDTVGRVGLLAVRTIQDVSLLENRRADTYRDKKFVFVLSDTDFAAIATQRARGAPITTLEDQVRSFVLG